MCAQLMQSTLCACMWLYCCSRKFSFIYLSSVIRETTLLALQGKPDRHLVEINLLAKHLAHSEAVANDMAQISPEACREANQIVGVALATEVTSLNLIVGKKNADKFTQKLSNCWNTWSILA